MPGLPEIMDNSAVSDPSVLQDDMYSIRTAGSDGFIERPLDYDGVANPFNGTVATQDRLIWMARTAEPGIPDKRMMIPTRNSDFRQFISAPPSYIQVERACMPVRVTLCDGVAPPVPERCGDYGWHGGDEPDPPKDPVDPPLGGIK